MRKLKAGNNEYEYKTQFPEYHGDNQYTLEKMFKHDIKELVELDYEYEDSGEIIKLTTERKIQLLLRAYGELLRKNN